MIAVHVPSVNVIGIIAIEVVTLQLQWAVAGLMSIMLVHVGSRDAGKRWLAAVRYGDDATAAPVAATDA